MSWTLETTHQNKDHISHLTSALTDATKANILLFCAAPDQGADTTRTYPAAAGGPCIRVGAAEASGEAYEWLGAAPVDFLFPGANVLRCRIGDVEGGIAGGGRLTGSNVATALAAGLAALALYCVQFAVQYAVVTNVQGQHVTAEDLRNLKTRHGMEAAFHAIGTTAASQHKYLEVWDVFGPAAKLGMGHLEREKREAIVMVARRLITTKKLDVLRR